MTKKQTDLDTPWKDVLNSYFPEFIAFFFPAIYFEFPISKLLDYKKQWNILEESLNPFATVVMAHLKYIETRDNPEERKTWKIILIRRLYERGYSQKDIIELFRFIDWILRLPKELENSFWKEFQQFEEERKMPYISSVERFGMEKGMKEGMKKGIEKGKTEGLREGFLSGIKLFLEFRFGDEGLELMPEICEIKDLKILKKVHNALKSVENTDELRQIYK
jgi:flagellar biosynthesis/type III secretory pathway protein FliH